jgi:drug/metabolite transporter (DMT)-like permease
MNDSHLEPDSPKASAQASAAPSNVLKACSFMLLAAIMFTAMQGSVRYLSATIHPFEIAFFRCFFGMLVIAPWFFNKKTSPLKTQNFGRHMWRAALNVVAMLLFFTALSFTATPIAQIQALAFTAPLFTTILAALILGEIVGIRRWSAVCLGFAGALIIIRPGIQPIDLGSMYVILSASIWAVCMILIKQLSRTDSSFTITAYMVILMSPLALIPALFYWTWPGPWEWFWLLFCGLLGTLAQWSMTQAFSLADATVVLPLDFSKVVWGALIGYFAFGELVDIWTWLGAGVIFSGATYIAMRERHLEKNNPLDSPTLSISQKVRNFFQI